MIGTTLSDRAAVSNEGIKIDTGAVSGLNMMAARLSPGAISESSSSHLPPSEASLVAKPVMFPPGRLSRGTMPLATGSPTLANTDRDRPRIALDGSGHRGRACQDGVGLKAHQLLRECSNPIDVTAAPPKVHPHVAAIGPTQVRKRLRERRQAKLPLRIVFVPRHENADAPHAAALLCTRRERPRRCAAQQECCRARSSRSPVRAPDPP